MHTILPFASLSVAEYYKKIKTKEVNLSTIGILKTNLGDGVSVSVMDSQKPFHFQLKQFMSEIKIKKFVFACLIKHFMDKAVAMLFQKI